MKIEKKDLPGIVLSSLRKKISEWLNLQINIIMWFVEVGSNDLEKKISKSFEPTFNKSHDYVDLTIHFSSSSTTTKMAIATTATL